MLLKLRDQVMSPDSLSMISNRYLPRSVLSIGWCMLPVQGSGFDNDLIDAEHFHVAIAAVKIIEAHGLRSAGISAAGEQKKNRQHGG